MSDKGSRSPSPRSRSPSPRAARSRSRSASPRAARSRSPDAQQDERAPRDGGAQGNNPGNNLYVANLSLRTTESELEELFAKFGRLEKCEVILDPGTRMSRGFGFVTFEDVRDAQDAVAEMNGKEVGGRTIRVEHAKRTRGHERTPGRYLGPLQASSKYGSSRDRDRDRGARDRSRDRGRRSRSRSRDRGGNSRRYDDRDRGDRRYDDRGRGGDRFDDRRRR